MRGKIYSIFIIFIVISIIWGLCVNNIILNRNIYSNEVHMKISEENYRNKVNKYNLDDMENKLDILEDKMDNPEKYKKDDNDIVFKVYVPRFRILFSMNPLDLRFETKNYKIYFNDKITINIKNEMYYISNGLHKFIINITYNLGNSRNRLTNMRFKISAIKAKIYSIIKKE